MLLVTFAEARQIERALLAVAVGDNCELLTSVPERSNFAVPDDDAVAGRLAGEPTTLFASRRPTRRTRARAVSPKSKRAVAVVA
jgi:hypothetical protein